MLDLRFFASDPEVMWEVLSETCTQLLNQEFPKFTKENFSLQIHAEGKGHGQWLQLWPHIKNLNQVLADANTDACVSRTASLFFK